MNFIVFYLLVFISLPLFGNSAQAADTKQQQPPPAQKAAVQVKAEIRSVSPSVIRTQPGKTVSITLNGAFLDKVSGIVVLSGNRKVPDIQVTLGSTSDSTRQASLRVGQSAKPGKYGVRATAANQVIDVPLNVFSIEVIPAAQDGPGSPAGARGTQAAVPDTKREPTTAAPAPPAPASGKPQAAQSGGSTTTPAMKPVVVDTDKITATVKETAPPLKASQPVVITTDRITATIKPTAPALSATEAVVITTDPLTATIKKTEPGY